jgi:hypothetical protein
MIVYKRLWKDLVLHYVFVFLILSTFTKKGSFVSFMAASFVASAAIVFMNHVFFPWLRLEAFQACYLRTGGRPRDCPLRPFCPHMRMCDYNAQR